MFNRQGGYAPLYCGAFAFCFRWYWKINEHSTALLLALALDGFAFSKITNLWTPKCLIIGEVLCRLRWNLVMCGSSSHKMFLYDEKAWSVAIVGSKGHALWRWMDSWLASLLEATVTRREA
jgi:hypothetical protein